MFCFVEHFLIPIEFFIVSQDNCESRDIYL